MDWTKPTTQLLGRFQPWHQGHTELFKRALSKTGQVVILLREQDGTDSNPFTTEQRVNFIKEALSAYAKARDTFKEDASVRKSKARAYKEKKLHKADFTRTPKWAIHPHLAYDPSPEIKYSSKTILEIIDQLDLSAYDSERAANHAQGLKLALVNFLENGDF